VNFPEIAESEVISASLMSEADMLEARLAVIRSPEIQNNLREVSVLRERLKALALIRGLERLKIAKPLIFSLCA
jgi:hypothetical protein